MGQKNINQLLQSNVKYSKQAVQYLRVIEDFDIKKFEEWFFKNILIGGGDIMNYLINKK